MPCRAEKEAILIGAGITRAPFPPDALGELPPPGEWAPSAADLASRRDLRGQLIASIDPPGLPRNTHILSESDYTSSTSKYELSCEYLSAI
jgi:exoribonuclease R